MLPLVAEELRRIAPTRDQEPLGRRDITFADDLPARAKPHIPMAEAKKANNDERNR